MTWGAVAGAAIGVVGSSMAAGEQGQAGGMSMEEQRRQYDLNRADQAPYRIAGGQAVNRLSQMLGLGGTNGPGGLSEAQIREQLLPQFTTQTPAGLNMPSMRGSGADGQEQSALGAFSGSSTVDENALSAAIRERMNQGNQTAGAYDFTTDPSYQFRFNEGMKGVNNATAGRGSFLSGAALKAIQKYGQGAASQEYSNQFNRLSGLAGTGQTSVQNTNSLGAGMANNISGSLEGIGNANSANWINAANSIQGGLNNYNQQNALRKQTNGLQSNDQLWNQINGN